MDKKLSGLIDTDKGFDAEALVDNIKKAQEDYDKNKDSDEK